MSSIEYQKIEDELRRTIKIDYSEDDGKTSLRVVESWEAVVPQLRARIEIDYQSESSYRDVLLRVYHLLVRVENCVQGSSISQARSLWTHQKFSIFGAGGKAQRAGINAHELADIAAAYLAQPTLRSDHLDWLFIDILLFTELDGFGNSLMTGPPWDSFNWAFVLADGSQIKYHFLNLVLKPIAFLARYAVAPAIATWLYLREQNTAAILTASAFALYLLIRVLSIPALLQRRKKRKSAIQLLELMVVAYDLAAPPVINPTRLKSAVDEAIRQGAVFPNATLTIIDRLAAINATTCLPFNTTV